MARNLGIAALCLLAGLLGGVISYVLRSSPRPVPHKVVETLSPAAQPRLVVAQARALLYWHAVPCDGRYRTRVRALPALYYGQASWDVKADGTFAQCRIVLARRYFGLARHAPFALFCEVFIHETGHLLGFHEKGGLDHGQHSRDPRNVMYPVATARNMPAVCKVGLARGDQAPPLRILPRRQ
jgi:hypothetical protein